MSSPLPGGRHPGWRQPARPGVLAPAPAAVTMHLVLCLQGLQGQYQEKGAEARRLHRVAAETPLFKSRRTNAYALRTLGGVLPQLTG